MTPRVFWRFVEAQARTDDGSTFQTGIFEGDNGALVHGPVLSFQTGNLRRIPDPSPVICSAGGPGWPAQSHQSGVNWIISRF